MNVSQFSHDLAEISVTSESVDQYVEQFEDEVKRLLDAHAPMTEKNANV